MPARFGIVQATVVGQSQAQMFVNGGGETVEEVPALAARTGYDVLRDELARLMPGVAVQRSFKHAAGTPVFSQMFDNGTGTLTGSPAFWNIAAGGYEAHGNDARAALANGATASGLCVMVHYWHSQDLSSQLFTEAAWRDGMAAFYARLHADIAPLWGEFRILPVLTSGRPGEVNGSVARSRRIWRSMAGLDAYPGVARIPFVLPPVEASGTCGRGAVVSGSSDFTHITRASAWRLAALAAVRIAGLNGFNPPVCDAPRLARAVRTGANTLEAWVALPGKRRLVVQGAGGFRILSQAADCTPGAVDNAAAAAGWAKIPLAAPAPLRAGDRLACRAGSALAWFTNGPTPPRGPLLASFEDAGTGAARAITDGCEDLLDLARPAFTLCHEDRGVVIEGA